MVPLLARSLLSRSQRRLLALGTAAAAPGGVDVKTFKRQLLAYPVDVQGRTIQLHATTIWYLWNLIKYTAG